MSGTAFKLVGGHLALDLINTVEWRLDRTRAVDDLTAYDMLLRWAVQTTLLDTDTATRLDQMATAQPRKAAAEHRRVVQLRETAYAALVEQSGDAVAELPPTTETPSPTPYWRLPSNRGPGRRNRWPYAPRATGWPAPPSSSSLHPT